MGQSWMGKENRKLSTPHVSETTMRLSFGNAEEIRSFSAISSTYTVLLLVKAYWVARFTSNYAFRWSASHQIKRRRSSLIISFCWSVESRTRYLLNFVWFRCLGFGRGITIGLDNLGKNGVLSVILDTQLVV